MKFLAMIFAAALLWLISVAAYTIIAALWLNWIGDFGFSFHNLVGIAGILAAINTSVAINRTSQR